MVSLNIEYTDNILPFNNCINDGYDAAQSFAYPAYTGVSLPINLIVLAEVQLIASVLNATIKGSRKIDK
jgi:hypothetical protein